MNKIYSLVWNRSRNQIEVASELARSHGGNTGKGCAIGAPPALKVLASAILLSGCMAWAGLASAQTANCTYVNTSTGTILCGFGTIASGNGAVAIGTSAISYGSQSTALGGGAQAGTSGGTTNQSIALGAFAGATGDQSTALGNNAQAAGNSSIAIGGDDLDKVAQATYTATINGTSETKTGAALFTDLTGSTAIASGTYHSPAAGDGSVALGPQAMAGGSFTGATPSGTFTSNGVFDVAIGAQAQATGFSSIALGTGAAATADTSFAIGPNARASAPVTIAFGVSALANKTNAVAIGTGGTSATTYTQATGTGATAIGGNATAGAKASGNDAIALGGQSVSSGISAVAIGRGATASNQNDVALGSGSVTAAPHTGSLTVITGGAAPAGTPVAANGVLSVGSAGKERQIQNVAAGAISQTSTDAVNGSQLYAVGSQVNTNTANIAANTAAITSTTTDLDSLGASVATTLGAGTTYSSTTGTISGFSQPIDTVSATGAVSGPANQTTVGAALTQLNTNVDNTANIAVKYDAANGNKITLGAIGGTAPLAGGVTITNLKAGAIASGSTDAVNGGQLYAVQQTASEGWNVTTAATGSGVANGTIVANVAPGATATFTAGNNIIETQSGTTVAFGVNPVLTGLTSVALASGPAISSTGINMGNTKITNLAAGTLSATSTDAVNGSELYATNQNVAANTTAISAATTELGNLGSSMASALGGGAAYNSGTGTISAPSYDVYGSTDNDVGQAISDLQTKAPVQYSDASGNPTPQVPSNDVMLVGAATGPVTLHNVAAGALNATSTEAVNGSQLYTTNQNVAANTTAIATNTNAIATNAGDITSLQQDALQWNPALNGGAGAYDASHGGAGTQVITNVSGGALNATSTDAVNGSQLYAVAQTASEGWNVTTSAIGTGVANGTSVANVAPGTTATFTADNNIIATQSGTTVAIGVNPVLTGLTSIALTSGPALSSTGIDMGGAKISNLAAGTNPGDAVNYSQLQSVAGSIGNAVQYDNPGDTSVTLGGLGATSPVTLANVAAGALNATSTDAVNGSQLYATNQNVAANTTAIATTATNIDNLGNSAAAALGGGAAYDSGTGTISAPSYDVYGSTDNNIGQAISDLQTKAPVQYSDASGNPTPQVPSNDVALVGAASGPVALHNVADGVVGASSTDAVNGSQLYAVQQTAGAGWNLSANGGTAVNVAPGATLDVSAGPSGNVTVAQSGTGLTIDASENPNFTTVTTSGDITAAGMLNANGGLMVASGQTVNMGGNAVSNIAGGTLSATSTDAVNGSQLYATNQNVAANAANLQTLGTGMAAGLGGASSYDPLTGTLTTSIEYNGNSYGSVQSVFDQIDGAVNGGVGIKYFHVNSTGADAQALGTDSVAIGANAIATDPGDVALGSGSTTAAANPVSGVTLWGSAYTFAGATPTSVVSVGSAGSERQVTNVAAGQLNATSTDAVNGSQLYATNQAVNSLGAQVNTNTSNISDLQSQINTINQNGAGMFQVSKDLDNKPMPTPTGTNSAAGGAGASASGTNSLAMGNGSNAGGNQSTAVGTSAAATGTDSTAIGEGAQASGNNSVAIGTGSVASDDNTVSVGSAGNLRKITNVAAGTAPTDAATVGQLQAAQSGGVQYDSHADGSTDYTNVTMDQGGAPATIHNVAAGTASNDAVNVGQLNAGISTAENWAQTYTDQRFNQLRGDLSQLGNRANAGIASAIAAANLPQPYAPNQSALSVGLGTFRGETGMAVGLSKITESGRYILKANASSDTRGDLGAGVGAAVVW